MEEVRTQVKEALRRISLIGASLKMEGNTVSVVGAIITQFSALPPTTAAQLRMNVEAEG